MDEALKYSRLLFHLLIATCAAITGLALSPDKIAPFDVLRKDLILIQAMIKPPGGNRAIAEYKDALIERHTRARATLRRVLQDLGIALSPNVRISDLIPVDDPFLRLVQREDTVTVGQIEDAVTNPPSLEVFKTDDFAGEITAWLTPFRNVNATLESVRLGGIQGAGRPNLEAYFALSIPTQDFVSNHSCPN